MTEPNYVRGDKGRFAPGNNPPNQITTTERGRELAKKKWDDHFERAAENAMAEAQKMGLDIGPSNAPTNARVFGIFFSLLTKQLFRLLQKEEMTAAEFRDIQRMSEYWAKNLRLHPDQETSSGGNVSVKTEGQTVVLITPETTRALELLRPRKDSEVVDAEVEDTEESQEAE